MRPSGLLVCLCCRRRRGSCCFAVECGRRCVPSSMTGLFCVLCALWVLASPLPRRLAMIGACGAACGQRLKNTGTGAQTQTHIHERENALRNRQERGRTKPAGSVFVWGLGGGLFGPTFCHFVVYFFSSRARISVEISIHCSGFILQCVVPCRGATGRELEQFSH